MKVKVAEYREQTDSAYDQIQAHWCACVGDKEKISWFAVSFRVFNRLSQMECSRANERDQERYENVFDRFSTHCDKHEALWMRARAYVILCENGIDQREAMQRVTQTEVEILRLSVIMPHFARQVA